MMNDLHEKILTFLLIFFLLFFCGMLYRDIRTEEVTRGEMAGLMQRVEDMEKFIEYIFPDSVKQEAKIKK